MIKNLSVDEFLTAENAVIVDVRTPAEFALGHIDGAINLPLFSNLERAEVGTIYVRQGKEPAVERGLELVGVRLADLVRSAREIAQGRTLLLYCWRGGMRSASVAWLLSTAGMEVALLRGGYKAYRRDFDRQLKKPWKFIVLTGATGSGKTDILHEIANTGEQMLDLEGLANHKGSVFGGMGQAPQPTTETFINRLHDALRSFDPQRPVWCEGESITIGHVFIPQEFFLRLTQAPLVDFTLERGARVERLVKEYGSFPSEQLIEAFGKIQKRLGTDNATRAIEALKQGDIATAAKIALTYYDKGYQKSFEKRTSTQSIRYHAQTDNPKESAVKLIELARGL